MTNMYNLTCNEEQPTCNNNKISCIDEQHSIPGNVILKTSYGSLGSRTLDFTNISTLTLNQRIASTTIDTTNMRNPKLLIDFNGILNLMSNYTDVFTFKFTLTMTCKNNKTSQALTTFTFNFLNLYPSPAGDSRTLKFEYSPDIDLCEDCCCYTLELTSIQTSSNPIFDFSISSGIISILAIDSKKSSCLSYMNNKDSGNALLSIKSNISYSRIIDFTTPDLLTTLNQPIANVCMDTTFMKKPKLLLDFTGILDIVPIDTTSVTTLYFTLFKLCKNNKVRTPLTTFSFSNINFSNAYFVSSPNSQTLKFEYSPCDEGCDKCCSYILELTSVYNDYAGTLPLSISSGTFSALAFDCCLNKYNKLSGNSLFSSNTCSFFIGRNTPNAGQTQIFNLPIVSTRIDTSYLTAPKLLIDFAGILQIDSFQAVTITFNFTLYRTCKSDNVLQPLTTFVYNSIQTEVDNESKILKFEYSPDDDICADCCTYILELTSITSSQFTLIFDIGINNAVLSIIAVDPCN